MKRSWTVFGVIAGIVVVFGLLLAGSYNGLVTSRETVRSAINNLQSQYQRRADLVPNLVATVKGSADFEQTTLNQVVEARAKATSITIDPTNVTSEQLQQFQSAQSGLSSALGRLIAVAENYPDLKSTAAFQDLMTQLEGTENRIQVARADYGKAAQAYNTKIQRFPTNISAGLFGFTSFPYFSADQGAEAAPKVDFNPTPAPVAQ
ncbi:LemA family protein [Candidatus Saccharibacteria bacterium]|nr:LemA family protein [Candidatus Saccharibacteria bacterium]